jgi:hypothetical protein
MIENYINRISVGKLVKALLKDIDISNFKINEILNKSRFTKQSKEDKVELKRLTDRHLTNLRMRGYLNSNIYGINGREPSQENILKLGRILKISMKIKKELESASSGVTL